MASDGSSFLVVWDDLRDGSWDVYGARVAGNRTLVDSSGIAISIVPADQSHPSVAFNGTAYFVVWEDKRNGHHEIFGARVGVDGSVLDASGRLLATDTKDLRNPAIASDGTGYLVAWQDSTCGSYDVYGVRVDRNGDVADSVKIPIGKGPYDQVGPRVAFDGVNYLVVWSDFTDDSCDVRGAWVGTQGNLIDSLGIDIAVGAGNQFGPAVVGGDGGALVTWLDSPVGEGLSEVYGTRADCYGHLLDPGGIRISDKPYREPEAPKISSGGTNYLVVWNDWEDDAGVRAVRVSAEGSVLDPVAIGVSPASCGGWSLATAFNGTDYLVAWKGTYPYDVCGVRVGTDGAVLDTSPVNFALAASDQSAPAAVSGGTNHLVVWHELRDGGYDIYGARTSPDGQVLDSSSMPISTVAADQEYPAVAFGRENFLVVWQDSRVESYGYPHAIYGTRVTRDGVVLDPSGIMISVAADYQAFPAVAFDGTNYLVVWQREILGPYTDLFGARVASDGTVIDTAAVAISTAPYGQAHAALTFNGAQYLVVWEDMRGGHRNDVYGARVDVDGHVVDPDGIPISTAVWHQSYPDVAFDGTNHLVVWHDQRNGASFDIYGARLGTDGSVVDPDGIAISTEVDDQRNPDVVYDGDCYFVAWRGHRDGFFDVDAARVSAAGVVLDPSGFAISREDQNQLSPALSLGPDGRVLVAYSSFTPQDYGSYRIWGDVYSDCAGVPGEPDVPGGVALYAITPNPFLASVAICFHLSREQMVSVGIYDAAGRAVREKVGGLFEAGAHRVVWDGALGDGRVAPPGVYFVDFETDGYRATRKVVRLK
ncbi:MAG: FlgD immunoglobulin-like domain containing protein [bacterium]